MILPHDFHFKKSLGQNFLIDKNIVENIVKSVSVSNDKTILEIGVGAGFLTRALLDHGYHVIGVEIDKQLYEYVSNEFKDENVSFVLGDILKLDWDKLSSEIHAVVGNIPYYITSQIIFRCLDYHDKLDEIVFMMQKEVGERILAKHGSKTFGILSIMCQTFWNVSKCMLVPKTVFIPKPDVDSIVIKFEKIEHGFSGLDEIMEFLDFIKRCFSKRRKILINTILKEYRVDKNDILNIYKKYSIPETARVEHVCVSCWKELFEVVK